MSPADIKELHLGVWRLLLRQCSGLTEALTALRLTFFFFGGLIHLKKSVVGLSPLPCWI